MFDICYVLFGILCVSFIYFVSVLYTLCLFGILCVLFGILMYVLYKSYEFIITTVSCTCRYSGHYFVSTLIYSVLLGFLGMDRFCLGNTGKFSTLILYVV